MIVFRSSENKSEIIINYNMPVSEFSGWNVSLKNPISGIRPPDKSAYWKIIIIISHPKHIVWVLKRTVSMRRFFWAPKTHVYINGLENK